MCVSEDGELEFNETPGEKAKWELHENDANCFE